MVRLPSSDTDTLGRKHAGSGGEAPAADRARPLTPPRKPHAAAPRRSVLRSALPGRALCPTARVTRDPWPEPSPLLATRMEQRTRLGLRRRSLV